MQLIKEHGEGTRVTLELKDQKIACVRGFVSQELSEIHYKAVPANLLDEIVIDFETLSPEIKNFYVRDLKLEQKQGIELITPEDMQIFHIGESAGTDDEAEE